MILSMWGFNMPIKKCKDCATSAYANYHGEVVFEFESSDENLDTVFDFCPNCGHKNKQKEGLHMSIEEKEAEFKKYVVEQICKTFAIKEPNSALKRDLPILAHNLIQDFKDEIEGFNKALMEENEQLKEKLEAFGDAFTEFSDKVNNYE